MADLASLLMTLATQGEMAPYEPKRPLYDLNPAPGRLTPGNIDLNARPLAPNEGGISTVYSMSTGFPEGQALYPRVSDDARIMTPDQATETYRRTGKHLGIFDTPTHADQYAQALHEQQAQMLEGLFGR